MDPPVKPEDGGAAVKSSLSYTALVRFNRTTQRVHEGTRS